jgi:hypothetical protein
MDGDRAAGGGARLLQQRTGNERCSCCSCAKAPTAPSGWTRSAMVEDLPCSLGCRTPGRCLHAARLRECCATLPAPRGGPGTDAESYRGRAGAGRRHPGRCTASSWRSRYRTPRRWWCPSSARRIQPPPMIAPRSPAPAPESEAVAEPPPRGADVRVPPARRYHADRDVVRVHGQEERDGAALQAVGARRRHPDVPVL